MMNPPIRRLLFPLLLLGTVGLLHAQPAAVKPETKTQAAPFVIPPDVNGLKAIIAPPEKTKALKVAIFAGKGAPDDGIANVTARIQLLPQATVTRVQAGEWATLDLQAFDLVVFSGGSGSAQAEAIGLAGRNNVREYVRNGGGYTNGY
jgi:hypothetical protein